jgi:hypothetical protein
MWVERLSIRDEVLDFLVSEPTPAQIIAFHASEQAQEQLRRLLEQSRNGSLTEQEKQELEEMNQIEHFFTLIKAHAMKVLKDREIAAQR